MAKVVTLMNMMLLPKPAVPSNDKQQHNNQSSGTGVIGEITGATTDPPAELVHHESNPQTNN
jgi:hypothetical protein